MNSTVLHFSLNHDEVKYLVAADSRLGKLIQTIGELTVPIRNDYFQSLAHSIIGQQLSIKSAKTIYERVRKHCGQITPESILAASDDELRNCGLSTAKTIYLKDLSLKVVHQDIQLPNLSELTDGEVVEALTKIKGIGNWTAEMFLVFSLGRIDVFSFADAGLRRSISWLYQLDGGSDADENFIRNLTGNWKPYRTVASLYLWKVINRGIVARPSADLLGT